MCRKASATAASSSTPLDVQTEAGSLAEEVLGALPDHPGAHHYVIHAFDSPDLAGRALPVAPSYGAVAPAHPPAPHTTSPIFTPAPINT